MFSPVINRYRGPSNHGNLLNEMRGSKLQQVYRNTRETNRPDRAACRSYRDTDRTNTDTSRHSPYGNRDNRVGNRKRNKLDFRRALKTCTGHAGELVLDELERYGVAT